jgi:hypothetical protein
MDAEARGDLALDELRGAVGIASLPAKPRDQAQYRDLLEYPTWTYGVHPALRSNIGGVDGFLIGQVLAKPFLTLQITPRLSMSTVLAVNIVDNVDKLQQRDTTTRLPPVRSLLETYQSTSEEAWLDQWEANYLFPIARDWFGRVSGGIFEEMYGGVAAEVLYRPLHSRFALGLDLSYVKQRDFDQRLDFLDYEVATGHLSAYYRTPLEGVVVKASAGRYLARDWGASLDVAQRCGHGGVRNQDQRLRQGLRRGLLRQGHLPANPDVGVLSRCNQGHGQFQLSFPDPRWRAEGCQRPQALRRGRSFQRGADP